MKATRLYRFLLAITPPRIRRELAYQREYTHDLLREDIRKNNELSELRHAVATKDRELERASTQIRDAQADGYRLNGELRRVRQERDQFLTSTARHGFLAEELKSQVLVQREIMDTNQKVIEALVDVDITTKTRSSKGARKRAANPRKARPDVADHPVVVGGGTGLPTPASGGRRRTDSEADADASGDGRVRGEAR